ncbi:hypothetical protein C8Q74DRAFT_1373524 [Fomes fomentarius]|nr:hypothetical protein C8Q74DRAFT_1373524 [Fomes fomentarius]
MTQFTRDFVPSIEEGTSGDISAREFSGAQKFNDVSGTALSSIDATLDNQDIWTAIRNSTRASVRGAKFALHVYSMTSPPKPLPRRSLGHHASVESVNGATTLIEDHERAQHERHLETRSNPSPPLTTTRSL